MTCILTERVTSGTAVNRQALG